MRIYLSVLVFLSSYMFASTITSHNIYTRDNRVDIMLAFDTPFDTPVQQQKGDDFIKITLVGVKVNENINEQISSDFVTQMKITSYDGKIEVLLKTVNSTTIIASKTVDGFGLRLRVKSKDVASKDKLANIKDSIKKEIESKDSSSSTDYSKYYMVVAILLLIFILLLVVKKVVEKSRFKNRNSQNSKEPNLSILYQKMVDDKNRLMLFEFEGVEYLLMVGNSNILLNKKDIKNQNSEKSKTKQQEFEDMLRERGVDLDSTNIRIRN